MATLACQFSKAVGNIEPVDHTSHVPAAHEHVSDAFTTDERLKEAPPNCVNVDDAYIDRRMPRGLGSS